MANARKLTLLLGDLLTLYIALFLVLFFRYYGTTETDLLIPQHLLPFTLLFLAWAVVFQIARLYELQYVRNDAEFIQRLLWAMAVNAGLSVFVFYFIPAFGIRPRFNLFGVLLTSTVFIFLGRQAARILLHSIAEGRVLFLGITDETVELAEYMRQNPQFGWRVVALMHADHGLHERKTEIPLLSFEADLETFTKKHGISLVIITPEVSDDPRLIKALVGLLPTGISIRQLHSFYESITGKVPVSLITERWFLENPLVGQRFLFDLTKRAVDIASGILFLAVLAVLTPFIAAAIRWETKGPIFYKQRRIGRNGREFTIYKFRSMAADAEARGGAQWASDDDPRVTRVGRILRKTRLDELPQIFSVLSGDLSFVGPRPERPEFVSELRKKIPFYDIRHIVNPGLTGWAQINFPYGASANDAMEKLQYELFYIKNRSIALDLTILLKTVTTVLSGAGR